MARKYLNNKNESITLSDDHLDKAIQIYEELSKSSPSLRVSWKKHQRMLEKEGFFESDSSENYRCTIKAERKRRGILPSVEKHVDLLSENKLEAFKEVIGDIDFRKKEAQLTFNKLNKLKRETTQEILLTEFISEAISRIDLTDLNDYSYNPTTISGENVIFATFADLHYGYDGSNTLNNYNTEIATELVMEYADRLIDQGIKENASKIIVGNMGDLQEGFLRRSSVFDTQLTLVQQTVNATRLVIAFLKKLANHFERVDYTGIGGNHDRISERYKEAIHGDNLMVISNAFIEDVMAENDKIFYFEPTDIYYNHMNVNGFNLLMVHGDNGRVDDKYFAEQAAFLGIDIDLIMSAHLHRFEVKEVGEDKYIVVSGSFKGTDDYSFKLRKGASRSQVAIIISPEGEFEVKQIKLG